MLCGKWLLNRRCLCRQRFDKNTWVHQRSSYPGEIMSPCRIVVCNDISSLLMTSSPNLLVNPCLDWNTTWLAVTQLSLRLRCFAWPVFFFFFAQMNAPWIRCSLCHATREEYVFTRYNYRYIRRAERDRSSSPSPPGFLQHQSEDQNGTYFLYWKGWNFSVLQEKHSCFTIQIMLFVR